MALSAGEFYFILLPKRTLQNKIVFSFTKNSSTRRRAQSTEVFKSVRTCVRVRVVSFFFFKLGKDVDSMSFDQKMKLLNKMNNFALILLCVSLSRATDDDVAVLVTKIQSSSSVRITHRQHKQHTTNQRNSNARHPFLYKKDYYKNWLGLKTGTISK